MDSHLLMTVAMPTRRGGAKAGELPAPGAHLTPGLCEYPWPHQSYPETKGPHFQVTQTHPSFLRKTCDQIKPSNYLVRINKLASARMQAIPLLTPRRKRRQRVGCLNPVLRRDTSSPRQRSRVCSRACKAGSSSPDVTVLAGGWEAEIQAGTGTGTASLHPPLSH